MNRQTSVVMAGGGTAGHISPMLAIADAIRAADAAAAIHMVGTAEGMETRLVPAAGYPLATIGRVPLPRRPSLDLLKLPFRFAGAVRDAGRILRTAQADVVLGVGGYVCTPVYLAARRLRVPVVVHEANARAGIANRIGARVAARVATAFPGTGLGRAELVGMPMRPGIATLDRDSARAAARSALGLDAGLPTLVVTGGSSGAASINRAVVAALAATRRPASAAPTAQAPSSGAPAADAPAAGAPAAPAPAFQVLHITGRGKAMVDPAGAPLELPGYHQVEYVDGMEQAYAAADLLIARAGAGTVCELAAVGLPSVLVPLPIGNGEQRLNAGPLEDAGGALLVDDADFTAQWFQANIPALLADPERLAAMSAAARGLGIRDAAQSMARIVLAAANTPDMGN